MEISTTFLSIASLKLYGGYTAIESPLCTPALSICCIIPGIRTSTPSEIASTSSSVPIRYLSQSTGFSIFCARITSIYLSISFCVKAIVIFCPPITYDGLKSTGYPSFSAAATASALLITVNPLGRAIPNSSKSSSKRSLSSARSTLSAGVPRMRIPFLSR